MAKIIYHYDRETKKYLGSSNAKRSPADKELVYLMPANATDIEPIIEEGKIAKFVDGAWVYEDKIKPKKWYKRDDAFIESEEVVKNATLATEEEINDYKLDNAKKQKLIALKSNRDASLSNLTFPLTIEKVKYLFQLKIEDLPILSAKISMLATATDTALWTDNNDNRVLVARADLRRIYNHIISDTDNVFTLYTDIKKQIKKANSIEELNLISIKF